MTLNITVLSIKAIYQSADFRLSVDGIPDPEPSTKRIIVTNDSWTGFITYTGVGRVGTEHTGNVVRGWLSGDAKRSFEQTVELLRAEGTTWLASIGPLAHTFVIAGYVNNSPRAAIVSNFERWHGRLDPSISTELNVSTIIARNRPEVIITGVRDSVRREER
jgi:hypothetical protein